MKKTLLCVLCSLMACFALSGCEIVKKVPDEPYGIMSPTQALYDALELLKPQVDTTAGKAENIDYCVVIDDGFGMKGFTSQFCSSYSAALSAVMDVTISGDHNYIAASKLLSGSAGTADGGDTFFQSATRSDFFREKPNDVATVIEAMAKQYEKNPDQMLILVSDLMIPTEDGCMKAASAMKNAFLVPENASVGLIGIIGDFRGIIENLPIQASTGQPRNIRDYMVLERDANGVFRHPLYILFMGNDQAVLSGMEKALTKLKTCGLLDDTNPVNALYFSEYDVSSIENSTNKFEFNFGCPDYNEADYDVKYIVRDIVDDDGETPYDSAAVISDADQQLLEDIHIVKLYTEARGETENNVTFNCTIPFSLLDTAAKGAISDKFGLLTPAKSLSLAEDDYSVNVDIRTLNYQEKNGVIKAEWVDADQSFIYCESKDINFRNNAIEVKLSVDTQLLDRDEPMLITVGVHVCADPQWDEIASLYDMDWIEDYTLNLKAFDKEFIRQNESPSSARFTYDSTAKTPFLSSLFVGAVGDQQIEITREAICDKTDACVVTGMFGIVVRDYPGKYITNQHWDDLEDFGGWAFSMDKAKELKGLLK